MKLEFVEYADPRSGDQVLRLYDFNEAEAVAFQQAIHQTLLNEGKPLDLTSLDFIEPLNCKLVLCLGSFKLLVQLGDRLE